MPIGGKQGGMIIYFLHFLHMWRQLRFSLITGPWDIEVSGSEQLYVDAEHRFALVYRSKHALPIERVFLASLHTSLADCDIYTVRERDARAIQAAGGHIRPRHNLLCIEVEGMRDYREGFAFFGEPVEYKPMVYVTRAYRW